MSTQVSFATYHPPHPIYMNQPTCTASHNPGICPACVDKPICVDPYPRSQAPCPACTSASVLTRVHVPMRPALRARAHARRPASTTCVREPKLTRIHDHMHPALRAQAHRHHEPMPRRACTSLCASHPNTHTTPHSPTQIHTPHAFTCMELGVNHPVHMQDIWDEAAWSCATQYLAIT